MKHKGHNAFRLGLKRNSEEMRFAEAWDSEHKRPNAGILGSLLSGSDEEPAHVTPDQRKTAATVIQWLGSPVGNAFLSDLGYRRRSR